jgi:putative PIN family toxin of toxin-antitoxin system
MPGLRAVLDANVLTSALIRPQGPPGQLLTLLFEEQAFELIVSDAILAELRRCLKYPRVRKYLTATEVELDLWVTALGLVADVVTGERALHVVADDPDDDKYLVAALEGRADYVVSGDRHLLDLRTYEEIQIIPPRQFLTILRKGM